MPVDWWSEIYVLEVTSSADDTSKVIWRVNISAPVYILVSLIVTSVVSG